MATANSGHLSARVRGVKEVNRISTEPRFDVGTFHAPELQSGVTGANDALSRAKRPRIFFLLVTVNGSANVSGHLNTEFLPPTAAALFVSAMGRIKEAGITDGSAATALPRAAAAEPGDESSESEARCWPSRSARSGQ